MDSPTYEKATAPIATVPRDAAAETQVSSEMQLLASAIDGLTNDLNLLEDRLHNGGVLREETTDAGTLSADEYRVPLADALHTNAMRVTHLCERVGSVVRRLEV